jgi:outer membrane receptor protein involved in Fe transport
MMILRLRSFLLLAFVLLCCLGKIQAQDTKAALSGVVTDKIGQPLVGATVRAVQDVSGTIFGTSTNASGAYSIANIVSSGTYTIKVSFVGYKSQTRIGVTFTSGETQKIDFSLSEEAIQTGEVIIEVNRAKQRETPVAFSDVSSKEINKQMNSQDAPLLVRTIPGVYSYSTDGVGNGESKLFVRGFDQNRVQVLINGIPTNDPESNSVYWSNWGAVSSAAASVQVQRGAGSSLYGSGSFGGSFNVITSEVSPKGSLDVHGSFGSPELGVYGVSAQSGLLANNFIAGGLLYDWKTGRGSREGAFYRGANYYASIAMYPDAKTSVKILIHGGPQEHGYSYNAPIAYFKKYGYDANPAYFLPIDVLSQAVGAKTLEDSMRLGGESRLLRDSKYLTLSHNFYHKPQLELHVTRDINENNSVQATFFYSVGRGGGSSLNSSGALSHATFGGDTTGYYGGGNSAYQNLDPSTGVIGTDVNAAKYVANRFLKNAYQRISYSLHQQWGIIGSWETKISEELKVTVGGEYRSWFADHPGYFTNLFGKSWLHAQTYGYRANGVLRSSTYTRRTYQGDMADFGGTDKVDVAYLNPFMGYTMGTANGTYNDQYRNYVGETKQGTGFLQANYKLLPNLTILGSIQYAFYNYHVYENMPSESAIADSSVAPTDLKEGLHPDGYFYMAGFASSTAANPNAWYRMKLVDITRDRNFYQPKLGFNYNLTDEVNVFANYSHAERMVDLSVFYNSGNPNPGADDEKSNQYELGAGFKNDVIDARLNVYNMSWENKTASITDVSKAGLPGYDRNGNRYELIGSSQNQGIEFQASIKLDNILPIKGFTLNASLALMDNKWTKVLDAVKVDLTKGALQEDTNLNGKLDAGEDQNGNNKLDENRRVFDNGALSMSKTAADADTAITNYLYYSELENSVNASTPFTNITYGITYENDTWFAGISAMTSLDFYALDGGSYIPVDGYFNMNTVIPKFIVTKWDNKLPASTVVDLQAGFKMDVNPVHVKVTGQVFNVFDTDYLVNANRSGVLPGVSRSFRLNVAVGI